jgi:phosphate transport system permease protein
MTLRRRPNFTLWICGGFSIFALIVLLTLIGVFIWQSLPVWRHEGLGYLTGKKWFYRREVFGTAPMIYGTLAVAFTALVIAAPVGIGAAVFASEYLGQRLRLVVKISVELLAGIPSVVYGLLGIQLLRDHVYQWLQPFDPLSGDTLLTAGILLAVMILPTIMTLSDDALRSVPASQRNAARGLGLNKTETILHVSLPIAFPGLLAAVFLSLGRACGEMIAVFLVIGRQDNQWPGSVLSLRPLFAAGQSLATKLGSSETNIAYGAPLHWAAMCATGLLLLTIVTSLTALGFRLRQILPNRES